MDNKDWDYLNYLTKKQIILFLKKELFMQAPSVRDVAYFKWDQKSKELIEKTEKYLESRMGKKIVKEHDCLLEIFNKEKDFEKRTNLMDRIIKLKQEFVDHRKIFDDIQEEHRKNDEEYEKHK